MGYIKDSLKNVLKIVLNRKLFFILLILIQILYLVAGASTLLHFQVKILEDVQGITNPLETANFDEKAIEAGQPLLKDILPIYERYKSLRTNLYLFAGWQLLLFLVLNGILWIASHKMLYKTKFKITDWLKQCLKFTVSTILFLITFIGVVYFLLKTFFWQEIMAGSITSASDTILILFLVSYYFLMSAFALITTSSWKLFLKQFWDATFSKIFVGGTLFIINLALIVGILVAIYFLTLNPQLFLIALVLLLLLMISVVILRLIWISILQNAKNNY